MRSLKPAALAATLLLSAAAPAAAATSTGGISAPGTGAAPQQRATHVAQAGTYVFPLRGRFTYGDGFGIDRPGHVHQGQDMAAAKGTPVVAPHAGVVTQVAYQRGGAGYYVVVSGTGDDLDYVFMHLVKGSTRISAGQVVRAGQRLGDVGSTGASTGPHLHFEVWKGAWAAGGRAVDPLPYLKRWLAA